MRERRDYKPRGTDRSKKIQQTKFRKSQMIARGAKGNVCYQIKGKTLRVSHIGKKDVTELRLVDATSREYMDIAMKWQDDKTVFQERLAALKACEEEKEFNAAEPTQTEQESNELPEDTTIEVTDNTEQTTT